MATEATTPENEEVEQIVSVASVKPQSRKSLRDAVTSSENINLDLSDIYCQNSNNSRGEESYCDAEFQELMATIEAAGGLLQPLHVVKVEPTEETNNREYALNAGFRRYNALLKLSEKDPRFAKSVPCVSRECDDETVYYLLQLLENKHKQLTPIELAEAIEKLLADKEAELQQSDIAGLLGLTEAAVSQRRKLMTLSPRIRTLVHNGEIPYKSARILAYSVPQDQQMNWAKIAMRLAPIDFEAKVKAAYSKTPEGGEDSEDKTRRSGKRTVTPKKLETFYLPFLRMRAKKADAEKKVFTAADVEKARLDAIESVLAHEDCELSKQIAPYIEQKEAEEDRKKKNESAAKNEEKFFKALAKRAEDLFKAAPVDPSKAVSPHDFFVEVYNETKKSAGFGEKKPSKEQKKFVEELGFALDFDEDKFMEALNKSWAKRQEEARQRAEEREKKRREKEQQEKEAAASK